MWPCLQLQSLTYLRRTVGSSVKWPSLGFNKWDTSRKTGKPGYARASSDTSDVHASPASPFIVMLCQLLLPLVCLATKTNMCAGVCRQAPVCNMRGRAAAEPVCQHDQP